MSTEASPSAPQVQVEQAFPDASADAVSARFRESISKLPTDKQPDWFPKVKVEDIPGIPTEEKPKVEEKKETGKDAKKEESAIPDDFLGETTPANDFDSLMAEEPKGQVKHDHFKRVKEAAKAEVARIRAELDAVRKKVPGDDYVPEKLSKLIEEQKSLLAKREETIARLSVERSERFHELFTVKEEGILARLNKTAKELGIDEDIVPRLLGASVKKREEILSDAELNIAGSGMIGAILDHHDQLSSEKQAFLENWKSNSVKLEEQARAEEDARNAKIKEHEERIFDGVLKDMAGKYAFLQKKEGKDDWNRAIDDDIATAKKFMSGDFTAEEFSEVVLAGASAKRMYGMFELARDKYLAAFKELSELKAAGPATPRGPDGSSEPDLSKMTPDERAAWTFRNSVANAENNGFRR